QPDLLVVLLKSGFAHWASLSDGKTGKLFEVEVTTASEQGLLGLVFHPRYLENGKLYLNYTTVKDGTDVSRIEEWTVAPGSDLRAVTPKPARVLLEVEQPYQNHNGGHLLFGPDGYLYIGLGDGGFAGDPQGNGQRLETLLGKMLRIDVDQPTGGRPYGIPADNPFVGRADVRAEIFAYGLRNPWRYSFDPKGRLVVADVGQDAWEELSFAAVGDNLGWNVREGRHCFSPSSGCKKGGLVDPFYEYPHEDGQSVIGGQVYTGTRIPMLTGKYVFGDFVSGRLWALELPADADAPHPGPLPSGEGVLALGKWPILPTHFARDEEGTLYVADFYTGSVYRIDAK
ncbi:MAG: PQQ-dependent sugar dehydrogenase, partial [Myxococcota bacterium]